MHMPAIILGLFGLAGLLFAVGTIRPMTRRRKKYDAGAVSDYWLQTQRGDRTSNHSNE